MMALNKNKSDKRRHQDRRSIKDHTQRIPELHENQNEGKKNRGVTHPLLSRDYKEREKENLTAVLYSSTRSLCSFMHFSLMTAHPFYKDN